MRLLPPFLKVVFAFTAIAATAAVGFARINWPNPTFWGAYGWVQVPAIVWLAAWSAFDTLDRAVAARRSKTLAVRETARRDGEAVLRGTLVSVHQLTRVDWTQLGLHLFLVEKRWRRWPWPFRYEVQEHVGRVKMSDYPPSTGIRFTKGKGVIGVCWRTKGFVAVDLRAAYASHLDDTEDDWKKVAETNGFGLTYDEFVRTRDYVGAILTAPILSDQGSRYLGCVSLDAPGDGFGQLDITPVRERLQAAANLVAPLVRKASA